MYLSIWQLVQKYDSLQIQVTFYIPPPRHLFHPPTIFDYMIKLIIICHPNLSLKHACGNHLFCFITQKGYKNDSAIISIPLPNQVVPEYPQKHALILHVQKPYQIRPANSTRHDYLGLVQFDLVDTYFCSK